MSSLPIRILPLALALAGACGLRAFLPAFYLILAIRIGLFPGRLLNVNLPDFIDIHSQGLLIGLAALTAVEIIVEKFPAIATDIDVFLLLFRIVGAVGITFAVLPTRDLPTAFSTSLLIGAIGVISIINLQVRHNADDVVHLPAYLNFVASFAIDAICLAVVSIGLQLPYVGLVILYPGTWICTIALSKWTRYVQQQALLNAMPSAPEMPEAFQPRPPAVQSDEAPPAQHLPGRVELDTE